MARPKLKKREPIKKRESAKSVKSKSLDLNEERQLTVRDRLLHIGGAIEKSPEDLYLPIRTNVMVSSGSTLLDLAISGGRVRGGGIPGGIVVEVFGPPGAGKTVFLSELAASVEHRGGDFKIGDKLKFNLNYECLLKCFTSPFISKVFI